MDQKSCPKTRMGIVLVLGQLWWKVLIHFKCWLLYIYTVAYIYIYIYRPNSIYTSIVLCMPTMSPDVSDFNVIEVRLSLNCQTEVSCSEAMLVEHLLLSLPLFWSTPAQGFPVADTTMSSSVLLWVERLPSKCAFSLMRLVGCVWRGAVVSYPLGLHWLCLSSCSQAILHFWQAQR